MSDSHVETQAAPRRRRSLFRRDESGLTTLEWLLIVAAVAGLAALAVVLVQNVVDDTAEQIGGSSARKTAAQVAATAVLQEAMSADPTDSRFNTWDKWDNYFTQNCDRIEITYSDADITVTSAFARPTGKTGTAAPTTAELGAATTAAASSTVAQADCNVT